MSKKGGKSEPHTRQMADLYSKIRQTYPAMSKAEKGIADYLLQTNFNILDHSADELSRATGTSGATIIRFCRTLGFKGYLELKFQVERNLVSFVGEEQQVELSDDLATVQHKVLSYYAALVDDLHYALDPEEVERAVELLVAADQIHIYSEGGSGAMALYGFNIFLHIGRYCHIETDSSHQIMAASYLTPQDTVLAISHSGRTVSTLQSLKMARENGASIIAITGRKDTPMKKYADVVLSANLNKPMYVSDLPASRLEEFCIFSVLQAALCVRGYDRASAMSKKVQKAINTRRLPRKSSGDTV